MLQKQSFFLYIGIAVIVAVAALTAFTMSGTQNTELTTAPEGSTEEGERQVRLEMIIRKTSGEENFGSYSGWVTLEPSVKTFGELLRQKDIHYGPSDVEDIFDGVFAEQHNEQQIFFTGKWILEIANRQEIKYLDSLNDYSLQSGDDIRLVYQRLPMDQRSLPDFPEFITYVDENDVRNGLGPTDYLSCINNGAIHNWYTHYQQGDADVPNYPYNPPICGAHIHAFPPTYQHVLPHNPEGFILSNSIDPLQIEPHILGHGMTNIHYNPNNVDSETLENLKKFVLDHSFIYLTPNDKLETKITLTRWGMFAHLDDYNEEKLKIFQNAPYKILPPMHGSLQYYHTVIIH